MSADHVCTTTEATPRLAAALRDARARAQLAEQRMHWAKRERPDLVETWRSVFTAALRSAYDAILAAGFTGGSQ